jgi:hypothetical protein
MKISALPAGMRGFDCNARITPEHARRFVQAGYKFAVRYVRRSQRHDFDLSIGERDDLLAAGLALMVVQHVAAPGWSPTKNLGLQYGRIAADETLALKIPPGVMLWCDLEGVARAAKPEDVIGFCNAWYDAVRAAGYTPGLYVGFDPGLSAEQLYRRLKFAAYWSAYNLNRDLYPAVRGVQMRQMAAGRTDLVPGIPYEIDVNVVQADALYSLPVALVPEGDWP